MKVRSLREGADSETSMQHEPKMQLSMKAFLLLKSSAYTHEMLETKTAIQKKPQESDDTILPLTPMLSQHRRHSNRDSPIKVTKADNLKKNTNKACMQNKPGTPDIHKAFFGNAGQPIFFFNQSTSSDNHFSYFTNHCLHSQAALSIKSTTTTYLPPNL